MQSLNVMEAAQTNAGSRTRSWSRSRSCRRRFGHMVLKSIATRKHYFEIHPQCSTFVTLPRHFACQSIDTTQTVSSRMLDMSPASESMGTITADAMLVCSSFLINTSTTPICSLSFQVFLEADVVSWLSRDPIGEKSGLNLSRIVGNGSPNDYALLEMWRSSDHKTLTEAGPNNARLQSELVEITGICKTIEGANVAVNSGTSAQDMNKHYLRTFWWDVAASREAYSDLNLKTPSNSNRHAALKTMGELTHSWEGCYAYAIGLSSPSCGCSGGTAGDLDTPRTYLKPSILGCFLHWDEHVYSETAWREDDGGIHRATEESSFVTRKVTVHGFSGFKNKYILYGRLFADFSRVGLSGTGN